MSQATTERTGCTFAIKAFEGGTPWIMVEADAPGLSILKDGFLGIELREDVSFEEAQELAQLLRDKVAHIRNISFK